MGDEGHWKGAGAEGVSRLVEQKVAVAARWRGLYAEGAGLAGGQIVDDDDLARQDERAAPRGSVEVRRDVDVAVLPAELLDAVQQIAEANRVEGEPLAAEDVLLTVVLRQSPQKYDD
jgi:hypothetical protein